MCTPRPLLLSAAIAALFASSLFAAEPAPNQKRNLAEKADKPRFKITDRTWPAKPGEADICLWADDKLAAFCFGVDDNWQTDHAWWLEQQKKFGFPCTWFVIGERVGTGGLWGTWADWKKLLAAGNDVQSHTMTHLHVDAPGYKGVEWDYAESIKLFEQNLPGLKIVALAYPGGPNSKENSRELAAKYYITARGTVGTLNAVNKVDYFSVNATRLHAGDNPKAPWADIRQLIDPKSAMYFRGWGFYFTHQAEREKIPGIMDYLKKNESDFWVGLYADEARYGQERDTAKLKVTKSDAAEIRLTLTDEMDDTLFAYPLTVKVRLPDAWKTINANQSNKPIDARIIEHANARFALVKATPDKGEVILKP